MTGAESIAVVSPRLHGDAKDMLLYAYVLVSPFFLFSIAFGRDTAAMWILAVMVFLWTLDVIVSGWRIWIDRTYVLLALLLVAYAASTLSVYFQEPATTLHGATPLGRAFTTDIRLLFVITAFIVFVHFMIDAPASTLKQILHLQMFIGVVLAIVGILQFGAHQIVGAADFMTPEPTNESFVGFRSKGLALIQRGVFRTTSIFKEPSFFGFFLVPLVTKVVVAWRERVYIVNKTTHLVVGGILIFAVLTSIALSAILSIAIIFGLYAVSIMRSRKSSVGLWFIIGTYLVGGFLLILLSAGTFGERLALITDLRDGSTIDRLLRVYAGITVFLEHPFLGVGPGGFAFHYLRFGGFDTTTLASPLNIWVTILTDVGVIGTAFFVGFLFTMFRRAFSYARHDRLIGVYAWSALAYLVLLTTLDFWFVEFFWFEMAMLLTLSVRAEWGRDAVY